MIAIFATALGRRPHQLDSTRLRLPDTTRVRSEFPILVAHPLSQGLLAPSFFFFIDRAPTEFSPLPLHDALPIFCLCIGFRFLGGGRLFGAPAESRRQP